MVYAISDLHLPGGDKDKAMDIFGDKWQGHWQKICTNWEATIKADDVVLIPGDISWAMFLKDAEQDLKSIARLPGNKVLLRGNHDYWWSSIGRVRELLPNGMYALQNDSFVFDDVVVCGARGWTCPGSAGLSAKDEKIYLREAQRLELSLKDVERKRNGKTVIAMFHYPPFNDNREDSLFTDLLKSYGVDKAVYGHLHGRNLYHVFEGERDGIEYKMVSCDYIDFKPVRVL